VKSFLNQLFKKPATAPAQAIVLMYHRIGEATSDVWDITVSPANFEAQLNYLKKTGRLIALPELVAGIHKKYIKPNSIALTFDDGYLNNFLTAKPLLEHYQIPATFFVSSVNLGQEKEFWWDELEHLFLFAEQLPPRLSLKIESTLLKYDLNREAQLTAEIKQKHQTWKAFEQEPPTSRTKIFLEVWQHLQPLPHAAQQEQLQKIRDWAGVKPSNREGYQCMSVPQLQELANSKLCSIGVHTVHHPALAAHPKAYQLGELQENRQFLEEVIGAEVNLLAYPYGSFNEDTFYAAADLHFYAGFTTQAKPVVLDDHPYRLGRFQVKNSNRKDFAAQFLKWEANAAENNNNGT